MSSIVINLGLKSVRAIAFSYEGSIMSSSKIEVQTTINGGQVEQNPKEWILKTKEVLFNCLNDISGEEINKVTFTTSASCLVLIDKNGNALRNVIMVSDKRSMKECEIIWNHYDYKLLH